MVLLTAFLIGAQSSFGSITVERVATGYGFTEGSVWHKGALYFSDIPGNKIYKHTGTEDPIVVHGNSQNANGNVIDADGNLVSCLHGGRSVVRWKNGKAEIIADKFEGKRLNSPNDAAFGPRGDLYFTDPPYGIRESDSELGFSGVFRVDRAGKVSVLSKDLKRPNGIAFAPGNKVAYVSDTAAGIVVKYAVLKDGRFGPGETLATGLPGADGLRVDVKGNLYVTAGGGVHVVSPKGEKLGVISTPDKPTNCAFGGKDMKTLYITAQKSIYQCVVPIPGKP